MRIITTGTGFFKAGLKGKITAGSEREVWLGPRGHEQKFTLPEFRVELDAGGSHDYCQYGRDFVFDTTPETGERFSREQMEAAFDKVKNKDNWKMPINAFIEPAEQDVTAAAIRYFAGSPSEFERIVTGRNQGKVRVTALGYYNCMGA